MSTAEDLRKKLILEKRLTPQLREYHAMLLRKFAAFYSLVGVQLPTQQLDAQLADILLTHYAAAQALFTGAIAREMPPEAAITPSEKAAIAAALVAYFLSKSRKQAESINRTTDRELRISVTLARDTQESDKPLLTRGEVALLAAGIAHRVIFGRVSSIATTETQMSVESTRATEVEVLLGYNPTVEGGDPKIAPSEAMKQWDTVGDSNVRDAHIAADGQQVPINEPFIVDGESLMFPGDTSLGASAGNIINCRCSPSYNTAQIAQQRLGG